MSQVGVFADRLELRARIPREPYLVGVFVTDAGGAENEIRVQSAPARGVTRRKPLDLQALELVPVGEHGNWIAGTLVVMESDADFRRIGERLDGLRHLLAGTRLGSLLSAGAGLGSAGAALSCLDEVSELLARKLKKAGDDVMGTFQLRLDRQFGEAKGDETAPDLGFKTEPWTIENSKLRLTLRCSTSAGAGSLSSWPRPRRWSDVELDATVRVPHGEALVEGTVKGRPDKAAIVDIGGGQEVTIEKLADVQLFDPPEDETDDE